MHPVRIFIMALALLVAVPSMPSMGHASPRASKSSRRKGKKRARRNLDRRCLRKLRRLGVPYRIAPPTKGVRTPVYIRGGRIRTITLLQGGKKGDVLMDCWLAVALARTSRIFNVNGGIKELIVGKAYSYRYVKNTDRLSRHAMGLALDIYAIRTEDGHTYWVQSDYQKGLGNGKTCEGHATTRGARLLRQLVCDLDRSHYFEKIITPDSDREHQDHIHLSTYRFWKKPYRRPHRTALLEPQNFSRRWVRRLPTRAHPSTWRVRHVVKARRRANRRLIRRMLRKRRRRTKKR